MLTLDFIKTLRDLTFSDQNRILGGTHRTKESTLTQITLQIACGGAKSATPTMTNVAPAVTRTRSAAAMATSISVLEVSANTIQMRCRLVMISDKMIYRNQRVVFFEEME